MLLLGHSTPLLSCSPLQPLAAPRGAPPRSHTSLIQSEFRLRVALRAATPPCPPQAAVAANANLLVAELGAAYALGPLGAPVLPPSPPPRPAPPAIQGPHAQCALAATPPAVALAPPPGSGSPGLPHELQSLRSLPASQQSQGLGSAGLSPKGRGQGRGSTGGMGSAGLGTGGTGLAGAAGHSRSGSTSSHSLTPMLPTLSAASTQALALVSRPMPLPAVRWKKRRYLLCCLSSFIVTCLTCVACT